MSPSPPQYLAVAQASQVRMQAAYDGGLRPDYRRFMQLWAHAHGLDSEFRGVPFPSNVYELPARAELDGLDDSDETTP